MTGKKHKHGKRSSKGRVAPSTDDNDSLVSNHLELDPVDNNIHKNNMSIMKKFRAMTRKSINETNTINVISNIRSGTAKWRQYATVRRKAAHAENETGLDRRRAGGIGLMYDLNGDVVDGSNTQHHVMVAQNRNLIEYFARLGQSQDEGECINLEYVKTILKNGANINCTDKYGQSIFHEVARAWHVDMAQFLIDNGANVNQGDNYGRTPLHVAAAVDYPEMVNFLILNGADKEILTKGEHQTPVHFAARNDACNSLRTLIKHGCQYKEVRDYKGRTPLHLAAELDRSETALMLLELDDPAPAGVEDNSGQAAIVWMICKMQPVAKVALDQFHTTDRANRKQYFHLHKLEPRKPDDDRDVYPQTALEVAVIFRKFDLIVHPVLLKTLGVKWQQFGRRRALFNTALSVALVLFWSAFGLILDYQKRHIYDLPQQIYRIVILVVAFLLMVWQIKDELTEYITSIRQHKNWKQWREKEIQRDIEFSHPRWPEEEVYLRQQVDELDHMKPQYINDFWNRFDWLCYALLVICIITHLVDVFNHTPYIARHHVRFMAVAIIFIWLRLMKNVRAYSTLGPFIVMLGHMMADVFKFCYLYLQFYIPFAIAFWMLFEGRRIPESNLGSQPANSTATVSGFQEVGPLLFSLFRITLVDDYDFDGMVVIDSVMSYILIAAWLAISAILLLNLFIALLSDTFQRVYDNAKANAVMQKAITVLNIEEGMSAKNRKKFRNYIHTKCNPEETYYDDDTTDSGEADLKKVTFQIKDQLDALEQAIKGEEEHNLQETGGTGELQRRNSVSKRRALVTTEILEQSISQLQKDIHSQQMALVEKINDDFAAMRSLLQSFALQRPTASSVPSAMTTHTATSPGHLAPITAMNLNARSLAVTKRRGESQGLLAMDDDWNESERQREEGLKRLREQLAHQGQSVWSTSGTQAQPVHSERITESQLEDTLTVEVTSPQTAEHNRDTEIPHHRTPRQDVWGDTPRIHLATANTQADDGHDSVC